MGPNTAAANKAIDYHNSIIAAVNSPEPITDAKAREYLSFLLITFRDMATILVEMERRVALETVVDEVFQNADSSTVH